jgi:hypothetical protein
MAIKKVGIYLSQATKRDEGVANAAITPGHLIERMSTGNMRVHAVAGGNTQGKLFADMDLLQGSELETAYAASARMFFVHAMPGDEINAILADGQTAVIGSLLESAGDGTLQVHVADTMTESIGADSSANVNSITVLGNQIVGVARAALDLSDSSGADPASARIRIEVL